MYIRIRKCKAIALHVHAELCMYGHMDYGILQTLVYVNFCVITYIQIYTNLYSRFKCINKWSTVNCIVDKITGAVLKW